MKFEKIKGDIFGGVTAGIVALPLALAFGVQSGLGAAAGLYGAMALGFFAAIFGGTSTQISGPTGPMTIVAATMVSIAVSKYGSIENAWGIVVLTFLLSGLFQILFGLVKIGKYIKYIPYPVLSGFMSGIGIIIILYQVFPMLGLTSPNKTIDIFTHLPSALKQYNIYAVILTVITILIIYLIPKITKTIPSTLIALIVVSVICFIFSLNAPLIGKMPTGLPSLKIASLTNISFSDIEIALVPAITLAGLGTIDSLLTSVVADNITRTKHNSNKELIGQGIGNVAASLIGGVPGAGATMRTVVNIKSGGKTKLSGVIHAALLVLIVLGLGKYVAYIPTSVLAGILITVGISIIDFKALKNILNIPKSDAIILLIVFFLTVFIDLLQAVGIGMVLASIIFMRKASNMIENTLSINQVKTNDEEMEWDDEPNNIAQKNYIYIKRFDGPMFFGVVSKMMDEVSKIPKNAKIVIFRMKKVPYIDQSGLYAIEQAVKEMQQRNILVVFTMMQDQPLFLLKKNRVIPNVIPKKHLFATIKEFSIWLKEYAKKHNLP